MLAATRLGYRLPDGRSLFEDVNVRLDPGTALVVEGPSGTGKSTLLALLGGLLAPSAGTVRLAAECGPRPFAWVLQSLNSLSARSALDNASLYATIDNEALRERRHRAESALHTLGLGDRLETRVRRLSGGELQRVAVARALSCHRPIVLADEPTNQLDRTNATLVMGALIGAADEGRSVLIVTHDHDAIAGRCRALRLTDSGLRDAS